MKRFICLFLGHREKSTFIMGGPFGPQLGSVKATLIDEHVSCSRCGCFLRYKIGSI